MISYLINGTVLSWDLRLALPPLVNWHVAVRTPTVRDISVITWDHLSGTIPRPWWLFRLHSPLNIWFCASRKSGCLATRIADADTRIVAFPSQRSSEGGRHHSRRETRAEVGERGQATFARRAPRRLVEVKANLQAACPPSLSTQTPPDALGAAPRGRALSPNGSGGRGRALRAPARGGRGRWRSARGQGGARGAGARGGRCGLWRRH